MKYLLTLSLVIFFSLPAFSQSREERRLDSPLMKYKENVVMAPDFSLKSLEGKTYRLSDYKGKKVVVLETGSST